MRPFLLAFVLLAAAALAGCPSSDDAPPPTVVVGLSYVCDSRFEYFNETLAVNTRIALARHTDNGLVHTKRGKVRIQLVSMAVSGKAGSPRDIFFETVNNHDAAVILGNACPVTATGMAEAADELGVPYLVPVAAAPSVLEGKDLVFGTGLSMKDRALAFAAFIDRDLEAGRVAILAQKESLQLDIHTGVFKEYFAGRPDAPTAVEAYATPSEMEQCIERLAALQPDVIVYCSDAPHVFTVGKELERLGVRIPLVATQSKMLFDYAKHLPQPPMPVYSLSFWNPEADAGESRAYAAEFEAATGHAPGEDDVYVYDTTLRLINAIKAANAVKAAGTATADRNSKTMSPEAIRLALASETPLTGAAGEYAFTPSAMPRQMWRLSLNDGRMSITAPQAPRSATP